MGAFKTIVSMKNEAMLGLSNFYGNLIYLNQYEQNKNDSLIIIVFVLLELV